MEEVSERERRSGTKETTDEVKGKEISSVKLKKKMNTDGRREKRQKERVGNTEKERGGERQRM